MTITSDLQIALSTTAAAVELGAIHVFRSLITSNGHPDEVVSWTLSGSACPAGCGAVDANGAFTAPPILPWSATVVLTAQSMADPAKHASATLTITSNFTLQLSAPTSVPVGTSAGIVATLTPLPASNPTRVLAWSLSGSGCTGTACGLLTVVTAQSSGGNVVADSATYVAPSSAPSPNTITITATPQADPSKRAQVTLAIQQAGSVILAPPTAMLADNHRVTLTVQVVGITNAGVAWSVNGIAGGNTTVG